jgi:endonuclease/exonuclease/phosphatase family metal-dependent hydrolase
VATWNLEWFYDNYDGDNYAQLAKEQRAPSRADWDWKLIGVAEAIAEMQPTIICLQEVENQRVLFYLTQRLKKDFGLNYRIAFLEGTDYFTEQDVGILYRSGLVSFTRREQSQEMVESKQYYNLTKQIFADFEWGPTEDRERLTIANVHFRASPQQTEVRKRQARLLKYWLREQIAQGDNVMLMGDFNTNDVLPHVDKNGEIALLLGMDTPETTDDLVDLLATIPHQPQFTHMIGRQFDRILVTPSLLKDDAQRTDLVFRKAEVRKNLVVRGKAQDKDHMDIFWKIPQAERDVSDHYPIVAEFDFTRKK